MPIPEGSYGLLYGYQHRNPHSFSLSSLPNLHGKIAAVTGANSGIGKWCALRLAQHGAKVYVLCRSKEKAENAMKWIRDEEGCERVELVFVPYDGGKLGSVWECARKVVEMEGEKGKLDILVLNAGVITDQVKGTEDGVESMLGVNHLAHFALCMGLLPLLKRGSEKGGDIRVVMTTSAGFQMHPDAKSLHVEDGEIHVSADGAGNTWWKGAMPMYGRSKACNILFAKELSRRLRRTEWGKRVRVNACHPGTVSTNLNDNLRAGSWYFTLLERVVYALASIPVDAASQSLLYAACAEQVRDQDISGEYMTPYGYVNHGATKGNPVESEKLAGELWEGSLALCRKHIQEFQVEVDI